ncbi:MAG: hypothetical protein F6K47_29765 [Symploca sp. SIO2E6]|nr:hypothetical protein [Symploca sp. SIO2E6]
MMLKLRVFTGTTLALLLSAGSGYSVLAIENTQTTTQQPSNTQLAHAGDRVTISGIVTDIDDDVVTVRTTDGETKDLWISEDLQEELGIEVGDAVSGTTHDPDDDVIPVDFVTRREVKPVRIELTERTRETRVTRPVAPSRPAPAPRPTPAPARPIPQPVPGLW